MFEAKDRSVPVILPDQDSDDIQEAYAMFADAVRRYNSSHRTQISNVDFFLIGSDFGGLQRDYRGTYVFRDRSAVL